ncbi:uncharacterized protein LOC119101685 [Pollicipes pollicipes]|uniref:uncharacterized protein LOC119101685 n=1 Tax=Pollicipes pollicipes TaxID=41117 RepID=UPI001885935D|nr:uncharacterized protein LOC119101685 [Pollicipes pollicipes]
MELLWRQRLFAPAGALLLRYHGDSRRRGGSHEQLRLWRQLMSRRFSVCCCLAAHEGADDALPHIKTVATEALWRGSAEPLLAAWQHCFFSERHGFQQLARRLLRQPTARRQLEPYVLRVVEEAQLAGREDVLRRLPEQALAVGEPHLYPLVFGALLDYQCLVEDVNSAQETFKLVSTLSIRLPSAVIDRYFSLLQRHRLKAPASLLRMKYRQRPPGGSAVPPAPPAWWVKW